MVMYCNNDPCEAEATQSYETESGGIMFLCEVCGEAFEMGQVNPNAVLLPLEDE